jgi:rare lipoprotein A
MRASWYGPGFHGRKTANGEVYDQMSFTAAHKSLKFGTLLKITNLKNNKSVVIRINDRGPYIHGRDLDLSKAAALELGMVRKGVAKMKVEEIKIAGLDNQLMN